MLNERKISAQGKSNSSGEGLEKRENKRNVNQKEAKHKEHNQH